jgi:hypothetical protein
VYDPEQDDWFYKDARRIYGEEAERYGVEDGSIVKVKCLAEAGGLLGPGDVGLGGGLLGEEDNIEGDMAAAAMEADATGPPAAAADGRVDDRADQAAAAVAADIGLEGEEMAAAVAAAGGATCGPKEEQDVKQVVPIMVKEEPVESSPNQPQQQQQQLGTAGDGPKLEAAAVGEVLLDSTMGVGAVGGVKREASVGDEELDQGEVKRVRLSPV